MKKECISRRFCLGVQLGHVDVLCGDERLEKATTTLRNCAMIVGDGPSDIRADRIKIEFLKRPDEERGSMAGFEPVKHVSCLSRGVRT